MAVSFLHPEFLLLLVLIPLAYWYDRKKKNKPLPSLVIPDLGAFAVKPTLKTQLVKWLPWMRMLSYALIIIAFARPQKPLDKQDIKAEGIDIIMTVDLSSSMLAQDFKPDRLEACKKVAADFIDKRPFDRIGLVVFAGESFTQCPLTTDHRIAKEMLNAMNCGYLEDGTAIGMGLATAVNRIKDSKAKSKVIILLTDGVNTAGYIAPDEAAKLAVTYGIKVYTIGVGSRGQALAPVSRFADGRYMYGLTNVEIDEDLLTKIAHETGAEYFRATDESSLRQIYAQIDKMEKSAFNVNTYIRRSEAFRWFLVWGVFFLLLELGLRLTWLRVIPDEV